MTYPFIDHRTLTADDIAACERLIAAYNAHGGHPPGPVPATGEWQLVTCTTLTDPDGKRLETEGVFKRSGSTQHAPDGSTHTRFVIMEFTPQGRALPGQGHGGRPGPRHIHPAGPGSPHTPPAPASPGRHPRR